MVKIGWTEQGEKPYAYVIQITSYSIHPCPSQHRKFFLLFSGFFLEIISFSSWAFQMNHLFLLFNTEINGF